ncbi:MAG TPA: hypothetical protein VNA69_18880 [Thermoanaerobaculia bacterium]|nr:hypothetical protein [Thermoanaerobaculia bacterium]
MTPLPPLMHLLRAISAAGRDCFFDSLVRELTEILGADFAFVAEIVVA